MPFNKTQVRNKLRGILNQFYNLNESGNIQIENFADFTESLENLWAVSSSLFERDKEGKYKQLNSDNYIQLMKAYSDAIDQASKLQIDEQQSPELAQLVDTLSEILRQDMSALENIVPGKNVTLPEITEKGRSTTVDLGKVQLVGSGNALSNRIPIEFPLPDGSTRKGFFTQKATVPGAEECMQALEPLKEKYSEYAFVFDHLAKLDDESLLMSDAWMPMVSMYGYGNGNKGDTREFREFGLENGFVNLPFTPDEKEKLLNAPDFWQLYVDLCDAINPFATAYMTYTKDKDWLGGKKGERIDNRNSAMSMVGKLLGRPELLAPAEPMTIIVDGKEIEGTFMENAVGKEVFGLDKDDPMVNYDVKNYDNPAVFADIADMQVIDYISGNVDRHEGNFFIQFEGEGENARMTKITGIDNDLSFGVNLTGLRVGNKFVQPKEMGIIDKDTAVKVMGLTENTLKISLKAFGLNDAQLDAAWQRTQELQQQIEKSIEHYKDAPEGKLDENIPRIVSKENLHNYNLKNLANVSYSSQFAVFKKFKENIKFNFGENEIARKEKDRVYTALNLKHAPEKPKAVRLGGKIVRNEIFIQPDKEVEMQQPQEQVDIEIADNAQLSKASGALSSRQAISYIDENGVEQKGFFTARTELDFHKSCERIFKDLRIQYPRFQDFLMIAEPYIINGMRPDYLTNKGLPGYSVSDMKILNKDPEFSKMLKGLSTQVKYVESLRDSYIRGMGAGADSTVDLRNVAMSGIAKAMGNSKLLANSKPMRIKQGDRYVEGVFMDLAVGKDYRSIHEGDPIVEYTEEVYNYGPGLKSLSDLQVLDYICMNPDRHHQNMMYKYENIDGQMKFVGVQGIDNDLSFGSKRHKADEVIDNFGSLNDIKYISKQQADFINNYDPSQIEDAVKGCRLSAKESGAILDRIETLKERIKNNQIQVLDDAAWNEKTLSDLCSGNNIYSRVKNNLIGPAIKHWAEINVPDPNKGELEFTKGEVKNFTDKQISDAEKSIDDRLKENLEARNNGELSQVEKIIKERSELDADIRKESEENKLAVNPLAGDGLAGTINKLNEINGLYKKSNHFFGGSKEYTNLGNAFNELRKTVKDAEGKNLNLQETAELIENVKEQLQYIDFAADAMVKKVGESSDSNQLDRKEFAAALKDFSKTAQKQLSDYNRAVLEKQEELNKEYFKKRYKQAKDFIAKEYPNKSNLNPRKEDQLLDYQIAMGLNNIASGMEQQFDIRDDTCLDLAAAVILKESFVAAEADTGVSAYESFKGKVKDIYNQYKQDDYVKQLAAEIAENPENFLVQYMEDKGKSYYNKFTHHASELQEQKLGDKIEIEQESVDVEVQKGFSLGK